LFFSGTTYSWRSGRCRGAATLSQHEQNKSADVQRNRSNFTHVKRRITWVRVIMTAANFSPAVANRRAKHVGDFRVPTSLGAKPKSHKNFSRRRATFLKMALQDYTQLFQGGRHALPHTHHADPSVLRAA
jgi:hypothetical protein